MAVEFAEEILLTLLFYNSTDRTDTVTSPNPALCCASTSSPHLLQRTPAPSSTEKEEEEEVLPVTVITYSSNIPDVLHPRKYHTLTTDISGAPEKLKVNFHSFSISRDHITITANMSWVLLSKRETNLSIDLLTVLFDVLDDRTPGTFYLKMSRPCTH